MTGLGSFTTSTLSASLAMHNANLATLQFSPNPGFTGAASLKIEIDDQGNTGSGGAKTDTRTINIAVDALPFVVSSDPKNNDVNVPTNKVITLTFSKPVKVNSNSFSLQCPAGAPKVFTVSPAGPASVYALTPTGGLPPSTVPPGSVCTVAAFQNQITDTTGNPLTADYVASFRVNAFPTVQSTLPATGAAGVRTPDNIVINFSEQVNVTAASFTLECPAGSMKTFAVTPASPA